MKGAVTLILIFGIALRATIFFVSPPGNAYDDHLEAVAQHITALRNLERVDPWECWQCYQPPLYYLISSSVAVISQEVVDFAATWKSVQFLSFLASSVTLVLAATALFLVLKEPKKERLALYFSLAILAVLPRSLFSSAMATNDALLETGVALCLVGYLLIIKRKNKIGLGLILVSLGTLMSCWTKQSGLILLGPLAALIFLTYSGYLTAYQRSSSRFLVLGLIAIFFLAGLDEVWRFARTGIFLVSNQNYFPYAISQLPGSLARISFFDFQGLDLYKEVFMGPETIGSFWTELFARSWFDYERRFFPINDQSILVGRTAYIFGGMILISAGWAAIIESIRKPVSMEKMLLLFILLAFLATPILQTLRMPYYSSMKATFILPGVPAFLCLVALGFSRWLHVPIIRAWLWTLLLGAIFFGVFLTYMFVSLSTEAWLNGLSGPLWPLPEF